MDPFGEELSNSHDSSPPRDGRNRQQSYRRRWGWFLLAFALAVLFTGIVVGQGLLIAGGLLLAAAALGRLTDHW